MNTNQSRKTESRNNVKIVIDVEMCRVQTRTCQYPCNNEIIQIGAVMMSESYEILHSFSTYVRPRYGRIDHFIGSLTGISEKSVKDAPDIEEALLQMMKWIGDYDVMFYSWSMTDYYQICKEIRLKCQDNLLWKKLLDQRNWVDYQERLGKRLDSAKLLKLSEALDLTEIDITGHLHDGRDDAYNTAQMIAKLELNTDYQTLIERIRANEANQKPLTVSFGGIFQTLALELA